MDWNLGIEPERQLPRQPQDSELGACLKRIIALSKQGGLMEPSENPAAAHLGSVIL